MQNIFHHQKVLTLQLFMFPQRTFAELSSYRDPKTKELLLQELRAKYKITISGPNTLSALLQSYHLGFQTLKVQQHATQIYTDLRVITNRFEKHFNNIKELRKKLEQAVSSVDSFGRMLDQ